jgi:hypothetical protein
MGWAISSPRLDTVSFDAVAGQAEPSGATVVRPFPARQRLSYSTLLQNEPNPVSANTVIWYFVKEVGPVSLKLYDARWREIGYFAVPENQSSEGNWYWVRFSVEMLRSGVYFYRLRTSGFSTIKAMTIVR